MDALAKIFLSLMPIWMGSTRKWSTILPLD